MPRDINRVLEFLKVPASAGRRYSVYPPGNFQVDRALSGLPPYRQPAATVTQPQYKSLLLYPLETDCHSISASDMGQNVFLHPSSKITENYRYYLFDLLSQLELLGVKLYGWDYWREFVAVSSDHVFSEWPPRGVYSYVTHAEHVYRDTWDSNPLAPYALMLSNVLICKLLSLYFGYGKVCYPVVDLTLAYETYSSIDYIVAKTKFEDHYIKMIGHLGPEWIVNNMPITPPALIREEHLPTISVDEPMEVIALDGNNEQVPLDIIESHHHFLIDLAVRNEESFLTATTCFDKLAFLLLYFDQSVIATEKIVTFFEVLFQRFPNLRHLFIELHWGPKVVNAEPAISTLLILPKTLRFPPKLNLLNFHEGKFLLSNLNTLSQIESISQIILNSVICIDDLREPLLPQFGKILD